MMPHEMNALLDLLGELVQLTRRLADKMDPPAAGLPALSPAAQSEVKEAAAAANVELPSLAGMEERPARSR